MISKSCLSLLAIVLTSNFCFSQSGYLDHTFNNTGFNLSISADYPMLIAYDMLVQPDQKSVVVCEGFTSSGRDLVVVRYNVDGSLDESFGTGGFVSYDQQGMVERVTSVALQSDGKLIAGGNMYISEGDINPTKWFAVRFLQDGTLDTSYGVSGAALIGSAEFVPLKTYDSAVQSDDKLLLVGETNTTGYDRGTTVRLDINGQLDLTFGINGVFYPYPQEVYNGIMGVKIQPDGMIVVCGDLLVQPSLSENDYLIMRFDQNGVMDNSFGNGGVVTLDAGPLYGSLMYISFQGDGKIVCSGLYYAGLATGGYCTSVIRISEQGEIDPSFGANGLVKIEYNPIHEELPYGVEIKSDGEIVVAFATPQLPPAQNSFFMIKKLNSDGTPDQSFGVDGLIQLNMTFGDAIHAMAIQSDDKIVISGIGTNQNDNMQTVLIARILPDELISSISEKAFVVNSSVYPNPAQDILQLSFELPNAEIGSIKMFDVSGKLIRTYIEKQLLFQGINNFTLDISHLTSPGVYILELNTADGRKSTVQFVKE